MYGEAPPRPCKRDNGTKDDLAKAKERAVHGGVGCVERRRQRPTRVQEI
jgi:hypothetical protein